MTEKAELIDLDHYCELMDQAALIEVVQDCELNLHFLKHPERGYLTAVQAGSAVLIMPGGYVDRRERVFRIAA